MKFLLTLFNIISALTIISFTEASTIKDRELQEDLLQVMNQQNINIKYKFFWNKLK